LDGTVQVQERRMLDAQNAAQVEAEEGHPVVRFSYDEDALGGIFLKSPALNLKIASIPLQVLLPALSPLRDGAWLVCFDFVLPDDEAHYLSGATLTQHTHPPRRAASSAAWRTAGSGRQGASELQRALHSAHCVQLPAKLT
jgi:hypothetical protein